jgi:outer membrane protein
MTRAPRRLSATTAVALASLTALVSLALLAEPAGAQNGLASRINPERIAGIQQGEAFIANSHSLAAQVRSWLAEDTVRLDLDRSIDIALQNATQIQLSSDTLRLNGISVLESYGRFLPSVTTTVGGFNDAGTALLSSTALVPSNAQYYGFGYSVSAGVNLFNGFRDREHLAATLRTRTAAYDAFGRARQQVSFDVAQAYYQVVLDRRLVGVAQSNLLLSQTRERQITDQVNVGTKAPPELYRQEAATRADESTLIDAQNRQSDDETALLRRLEVDPLKPFTVAEPAADTTALSADSLRVEQLVAAALHTRPDLAAAQEREAADQHEMNAAHGELLPQLRLGFDYLTNARVYGREEMNGVSQLTTSQQSLARQLGSQGLGQLSLGLSWDLFDDYRARLDEQKAQAAADHDHLIASDLRLRIDGEVQQAVGDYRAAEHKLVSTAAGLVAAQEAFDAMQGRYDVGLASFVDVVSAQTALAQARALREQALTNFALQKAVLRYVTGAPVTAQ